MIKKLNTEAFDDFLTTDTILFMRPTGAKLFRVCHIPEKYGEVDYQEIVELLNATCKIKRHGIWFFDYTLEELQQQVMKSLKEDFDIDSATMERDNDPETLN